MSLADTRPPTAEDLFQMPDSKGLELVDGEIREVPMGAESSIVGGELYALLREYARREKMGLAFPADTGVQCFPDDRNRVRKPDACFVCKDSVPTTGVPRGWLRMAPDVVVEVISPNDIAGEIETKIEQYLAAGVRLVWLVNPDTRTVQVYRPSGEGTRLHAGDTLSGEDVLPGFACGVGELFPAR